MPLSIPPPKIWSAFLPSAIKLMQPSEAARSPAFDLDSPAMPSSAVTSRASQQSNMTRYRHTHQELADIVFAQHWNTPQQVNQLRASTNEDRRETRGITQAVCNSSPRVAGLQPSEGPAMASTSRRRPLAGRKYNALCTFDYPDIVICEVLPSRQWLNADSCLACNRSGHPR